MCGGGQNIYLTQYAIATTTAAPVNVPKDTTSFQDTMESCTGDEVSDNYGDCCTADKLKNDDMGLQVCESSVRGDANVGKVRSSPALRGDAGCRNTDGDAQDSDGDKCSNYRKDWCGNHDDADFKSEEMCCVCGGGESPP